jgi:histidinol-phosphate phosphatase family protein
MGISTHHSSLITHHSPRGSAAVFLDKDGTLLADVPYNVDPDRCRLTPGAGEGLRRLAEAGFALVVVSNQSGVARGLFPESALEGVRRRVAELLAEHGVRLLDFRWCPHLPGGSVQRYAVECSCRKPSPGMLLSAAADHGLDPRRSWMVGDILDDIEAGRRAGCRTVLLDNGGETVWRLDRRERLPHHVAADLAEAAEIIAAMSRREGDRWSGPGGVSALKADMRSPESLRENMSAFRADMPPGPAMGIDSAAFGLSGSVNP